jgi:glycosyltransferase involved in cell wall biosynthesis
MGTIRILDFIPGFGLHGLTERMVVHSENILENEGEVHWISMEPGRPEWLVSDRIHIHHLTTGRRGDASQPFAGLDAGFAVRNYQAARELARLIKRLRPDQLNCWSSQSAWIATAARHWFGNPEMKRVNLIYYESYLSPLRKSISNRQLRLMDHHLAAIEVSHVSIQQELRAAGFSQRIEVVDSFPVIANSRSSSQVRFRRHSSTQSMLCDDQAGQPTKPFADPSTELGTEKKIEDSSALQWVNRQRLRSRLSLPENSFLAGAVAPLVPRTRIKDLIWATDLLSVFLENFHLIIWGTGTQHRDLIRFANQTEAADRIHFLYEGRAGGEDLAGLDCFWQAHLREPASWAMLNAMSLGVPVIAVAGQGTDEWIRHQQTGFSVNFGARDEFARWTKFLMEQVAAADQVATQARQWIELRANPRIDQSDNPTS